MLDNVNKLSVIYCKMCCVLFGELGWVNAVVWGPNLSYVLYILEVYFIAGLALLLSREMSVLQRRFCQIFDRFLIKRDEDLY